MISAQEAEIHVDSTVATAGYYQLSWSGTQGMEYEIQEAQSAQFDNAIIIYRGADTASVISGRPDGVYYYRVRQTDATAVSPGWSQPVRVEVKHHSLTDAWRFFTTGAVVFILILFFILYGYARSSVR